MSNFKHSALPKMLCAVALSQMTSMAFADQTILDDLIVDGSLCVGLDCVTGEAFDFDTVRLKENNLRIHFRDTSSTSSFPSTDWQLTANESSNGGANAFFLENLSQSTRPFVVDDTAGNNALFLGADRAGFGTSNPVVDLHTFSANTPTLRLEQNGLAAFTPQIWDVGGNEIYFFVRDVSNGSQLPFKILPAAPTNAFVVDPSGDVILGDDNNAGNFRFVIRNAANDADLLTLDDSGNLNIAGALSPPSSRALKSDLRPVDEDDLLAKVADLEVLEWQYTHDQTGARHLGVMAEDFHAAFGLGVSAERLAPADVAGVALAAIRAQQKKITALETQLADREQRLQAVEQALREQQGFIRSRLEMIESRLPAVHLTSATR